MADLERRTVAVDGGRLKLECGVLTARSGRDGEDVLCLDGDRLVGFVGLYAFGPPTVELAGMVDPSVRPPARDRVGAARCGACPLP